MRHIKTGPGFLLVLQKGELIVGSLLEFCHKQNLHSAWVSGLGAVLQAELGYYDLEAQEYRWQAFDKTAEITNLTGNIASIGGELAAHLHVTLADDQYRAVGGHLKEATVAGTCEIHLTLAEVELMRVKDSETGLNLLQF